MTLPDFFRRKYGPSVEVLTSLIMILAFSILLAGNLVAGGYLFSTFMGTSYGVGVALLAGIVLVYTVAGGLIAVAYTDFIQVGVALLGSLVLLGFVLVNFGITIPEGMGPFAFEQLTNPEMGAYINWATILALGLGDIVAIDFMQRVFAADSPETAQRACFAGSVGTLVIGVPFALVALSSGAILEQAGVAAGSGPVLYTMIQEVVPPVLGLLVLSGIVAASLSTSDGAVLGTSCVFARNVFGIREEQGGAEADKLLLTARIMAVPITLLGIFFALQIPETGILLTLAFDVLFAALFIPFVFGVYWPKANKPAAIAAIIIGSSTRLAFFVLITPTTYGVENTLAHIPNDTFTAAFDGLPTLICPLLALFTFAVLALATQDTYEPAVKDVRALVEDGVVAEPGV